MKRIRLPRGEGTFNVDGHEKTWNRNRPVAGLKRLLAAAGFEVVRRRPNWRRHVLRAQGISLVLDVGANVGQYGLALRDSGYSGRIVSFEPLSANFETLFRVCSDDPAWECRHVAIGAESAQVEIIVAMESTGSSVLSPTPLLIENIPGMAPAGTETVRLERLDDQESLGVEGERLMVKADVQGLELDVLRGAESVLNCSRAVEIEISLAPLYEGQPPVSDLVAFLAERGFELGVVRPTSLDQETGYPLQVDAIFLREGR